MSIPPLPSPLDSATRTQKSLFKAIQKVPGETSRAVRNLATPLSQYLRQSGTSKTTRLETPTAQSIDLDRSSSVESGVSTVDAHTFRQLHEDAAVRVVQTLKKLHGLQSNITPRSKPAPFPSCLDNLEQQTQRLDINSLSTESLDINDIREVVGGKNKSFRPTLKGFQYWKELRSITRAGRTGAEMPTNLKRVHLRVALAAYIRGALKTAKFGDGIFTLRTLDELIANEVVNGLNQQGWGKIRTINELTLQKSDGNLDTVKFKTTMTPACELSIAMAQSYKASKLRGVCSYATQEGRHSVNLWQTKFDSLSKATADDQTPKETRLFSGVRHGVHDAYGHGKDEYSRKMANDGRIEEFIAACLVDKIEKIKLTDDELNGRAVIDLPIVSVNLLTPVGKEKSMIANQTAAFERAQQTVFSVEVDGGSGHPPYKVKVSPRFVTFNLPVNHVSLSPVATPLGIWATADKMNEAGLNQLLGSAVEGAPIGGIVGAKLASLAEQLSSLPEANGTADQETQRSQLTQKIKEIQTLVSQVRKIFKNKSHHQVGQEPYKLPVRLLALANECGAVPAFNCKSGKDRTGQLNVEIRDFYAHYHGTGRLRDPDTVRSNNARRNYQTLFVDGGDREIQRLNTSVPGSKSQLPYYNHLLGVRTQTMDAIKGLSKWVGT